MNQEDLIIKSSTLGFVGTNCYFVAKKSAAVPVHGIVIDPAYDGKKIYEDLKAEGCVVDLVLLTHAHFDHIGGAYELCELSGAPLYCHALEKRLCEDTEANLSADYGLPCQVQPDRFLEDGELIRQDGLEIQVLSTPGHTEGSCCYYLPKEQVLFSGDTLFAQSVGRTDLPTGSTEKLMQSIREKLLVLPEETRVCPGHMDTTTIGYEKRVNPFF